MKTFGGIKALAVVLLLLALADQVRAQPADATRRGVADTITGVDEPPPGMSVAVPPIKPDLMMDYLRAVEAVDMAVDFEARGETKALLGVDRIKVDAKWEKRPGETSPSLRGLTLEPVGGRLNAGGMKINKIRINEKGEMKLDIHRFPDLTVKKITKDRDGNIRLHINWFPDVVIKADGAVKLFGMIGLGNIGGANTPIGDVVSNWPPRLEDVVNAMTKGGMSTGTTKHEGTLRYELAGRAAPFSVPLGPGGPPIAAASDFTVRGAAVLEPDGTFRTIGSDNTIKVDVRVGPRRLALPTVEGDVERGSASFTGRYAVAIPRGKKENLQLEVDGNVSYAIDGKNVTVSVPTGTKVRVSDVDVSGTAHLNVGVAPGRPGGAVVLSDGTYSLEATGPISVSGLAVRGLRTDELGFEGRFHSDGSFTPAGAGLSITGNGSGELTTTGPGVVDVLMGNDRVRGTIREGSRVGVRLDEFSARTGPDPSGRELVTLTEATGRGHIDAGLDLGNVAAESSAGRFTADAVRVDASLDVSGTNRGLTSASGTTRLRLDSDGAVSTRLPSAELPGELGARTHKVVAGDTLYKVARKYGVAVPALKRVNGLTSDTIAVGATLRIPGPQAPRSTTEAGHATTTVSRGSEATVDVRSARMGERGLELDGHITAKVNVSGLDLESGKLEAKILGAARASVDADFRLRPGADGRMALRTGKVRVPVRIEINRGSQIQVNLPGRETDVVMDRDGSYAEFTAVVEFGESGVQVDELAAVDVLLVSNGTARFAGDMVDVPGEKSIRYTGRVVLRERGLDFYGDITLNVRGPADRPIVRIRW